MMNRAMTTQEKNKLDDARSIFDTVFGTNIDPVIYENKHFGNPYRVSMPLSLSYEDGHAAGIAGFLGMKLEIGGRKLQVAQAMDVAVLEKYRGKGHFSKAVHAFETGCPDSRFVFALPNNASFPRFLTMGYKKALWLCHYLYFNSPFSFALGKNPLTGFLDRLFNSLLWIRKAKPEDGDKLTIHEGMDDIPVSDSELALAGSSLECHFLHNKKIYEWKQSYNPDIRFFWATLRRSDGSLIGYALCHLRPRLKGSFVIFDDYGVAPDVSDAKKTLRVLFAALSDLGNILEIPFVNVSRDGDMLRSLHFLNACRFPFPLRGGPLIVSPSCRHVHAIKNCSFRNIDSDVI